MGEAGERLRALEQFPAGCTATLRDDLKPDTYTMLAAVGFTFRSMYTVSSVAQNGRLIINDRLVSPSYFRKVEV